MLADLSKNENVLRAVLFILYIIDIIHTRSNFELTVPLHLVCGRRRSAGSELMTNDPEIEIESKPDCGKC